MISIMKLSKGDNSIKHVSGVTVQLLCTSSDTLYLYQVWCFRDMEQTQHPYRNLQRSKYISVKMWLQLWFYFFCIPSVNTFIPSFMKISQRLSELLSRQDSHYEIFKGA